MYQALIYIQFFLIAFILVISPILVDPLGKKPFWFCAILFELYVSQLFMYYPGADVSPYAYTQNMISAIRIVGFSLSALASILLLVWTLENIIYHQRVITQRIFILFIVVLIPNFWALLTSTSMTESIDYLVKLMTPFFILFYLYSCIDAKWFRMLSKTVTLINVFVCAQVLVCKALYGHFAAYNYYWEYAEEYFGYYNHPHSFSGLLAFLTIWNVYQINKKRDVRLNLALFLSNVVLMYLSGVRTYLLALAVGLAFIGLWALNSSRMKNIRRYVYCAIFAVCMFGVKLAQNIGLSRVVGGDLSSGRLRRWTEDLQYIFDNYSLPEVFFGSGVNAIFEINKEIFNNYINSLNIFIDILADYGLLGLMLLIAAYCMIFKLTLCKESAGFQWGVFVVFWTACIINNITSYVTIMIMMIIILLLMNYDGRNGIKSI